MPRRQDDDVAWPPAPEPARPAGRPAGTRYGTPERGIGRRSLLLAGGFLLAAGATLAVFLTENAQLLRVAVVAVAWAFVLATFAAGRRGVDRAAAAAREQQLRRDYEAELEREVAARREYELEVENEVRRETEDAVRDELDALRRELSSLSGLREEVARVSELRGDLAALGALRDEVARVAALRDDVAALTSLRQELGQLGELRADVGRLRAELTEQLSSEMLVERIIMRTQASRLPGEAARTLDQSVSWADDTPPRELTGGWPAIRLDEHREPRTQLFEQVRVDRAPLRPPPAPWEAGTSAYPAARPAAADRPAPADPPRTYEAPAYRAPVHEAAAHQAPEPPASTPSVHTPPVHTPPAHAPAHTYEAPVRQAPPPVPAPPAPVFSILPAHEPVERPEPVARHSRHSAEEPPAPPGTSAFPLAPPAPEPAPSPLDWLAARSLLDPEPAPAPIASRPEVPPRRRRGDEDRTPPLPVEVAPTAAQPAAEPTTTDRLARILAENGVEPSPGGRRRRRYREDDEPDEVLSRVLGRRS